MLHVWFKTGRVSQWDAEIGVFRGKKYVLECSGGTVAPQTSKVHFKYHACTDQIQEKNDDFVY